VDAQPGVLNRIAPAEPDTVARSRRIGRADLVTVLCYVGLAVVVVWPLWRDPAGVRLVASIEDQFLNEWNLSYAAHLVTHGGNPFITTAMNPPDGANLMANTSNLGLGILLAPVTLIFGPAVSLALALTLGLAGTATAWYWLLSRRILPAADAPPTGHWAAAVGGVFIGFSPSLVGHAGGTHLQFVMQILIPFIVWQATRLWHRPVRDGTILGLLVTYQLFLGEEMLLIVAMATAVFLAVMAVDRPRIIGRFVAGAGVAVAVVLVLAGYPLWTQFFGRQSYAGLPWGQALGTPLPAWTAYSTESLGGDEQRLPPGLALNTAEQNGFLGWSVIFLAVCAAVWLWRRSTVARALTITAVIFVVLAAGRDIVWAVGEPGVPSPWRLIARLPLFESILPSRFALAVIPCVAVLFALALHRLREPRPLLVAAVAAALLPIAPTPLVVADRPPVPTFFTDGQWTQFVRPGHALVVAPRPSSGYGDPLRWQYISGFAFRINSGYFVGPAGPAGSDRHGTYTPPARPSEQLLDRAFRSQQAQPVTADDQRAARADLDHWRADAVVVDPRLPGADAVRTTADQLYGSTGRLVGGVWVWDVRT
jgi:hypothetical protein